MTVFNRSDRIAGSFSFILTVSWGFLGGSSGEEPTCQRRGHKRCGFDPWVGKIACRRKWQSIFGNPISILAWEISWIEDPGGLQSIGLQRVGHI